MTAVKCIASVSTLYIPPPAPESRVNPLPPVNSKQSKTSSPCPLSQNGYVITSWSC